MIEKLKNLINKNDDKNNKLEEIRRILENNPYLLYKKDIDNLTPLDIVAIKGDANLMQLLVDNINSMKEANPISLEPVLKKARIENLQASLTENEINNEEFDLNILSSISAQQRERNIITQKLFETALYQATLYGHIKIVEILINNKTNLDIRQNRIRNTLLHIAAKENYVEITKLLIKSKANPNIKNIEDQTPLHYAVQYGKIDIIKILAENTSDINSRDKNGKTALHYAACYVNNDTNMIIMLLIKKGINANLKDNDSQTALDYATKNTAITEAKKREIIKILTENMKISSRPITDDITLLIKAIKHNDFGTAYIIIENRGKDIINEKDQDGLTALHHAILKENIDLIKFLVKNKANLNIKDNNNLNLIYYASSMKNCEEILQILKDNGANLRSNNNLNPTDTHYNFTLSYELNNLSQAIFKKDIKRIEESLNNIDNSDLPMFNGENIFNWAFYRGYVNITAILVKKKAYVKDIKNLIEEAFNVGYVKIAKIFINQIKDIDSPIYEDLRQNILYRASLGGNKEYTEIVEIMIKAGVDVDKKNSYGRNALYCAVLGQNFETLKILVKHTKDLNIQDIWGNSILNYYTISYIPINHDIKILLFLIEKGIDINLKNNHGKTFLDHLFLYKKIDIIRNIIENIKNPNILIINGENIFIWAIKNRHFWVIDILIKKEENIINKKYENDLTALHYAAAFGFSEIIELLLKNNVDINIRDKNNLPPIYYAMINNSEKVTKILKGNGAIIPRIISFYSAEYPNIYDLIDLIKISLEKEENSIILMIDDEPLLLWTIKNKQTYILEFLIKKGAYPLISTDNINLFDWALNNEFMIIAQYLIDKGENIDTKNKHGVTSLFRAASDGHKKIVKFLVKNKANIDLADNMSISPLEKSINLGYIEMVRFFIKHSAIKNPQYNIGKSFLHIASFHGYTEIVRLLIANGAGDINAKSNLGVMHLHTTNSQGYTEITKFLTINLGVNVINSQVNFISATPLHIATIKGHIEIIRILINNGADINAQTMEGDTILHLAALDRKKIYILRIFIEEKANLNLQNKEGHTALHKAIIANNIEAAKLLIKAGADINLPDNAGKIPENYATEKGYVDIIDLLEKKTNLIVKNTILIQDQNNLNIPKPLFQYSVNNNNYRS